jgi:hypothetical protein
MSSIGLTVKLTATIGAIGLCCGLGYWGGSRSKALPTIAGPTIVELEALGHLAAMRVHVADILVVEDARWKGSWLIKGDALLAVDMRRAAISDMDSGARRATITLPVPQVMQPRVNHQQTCTWDVKKTSWIPGLLLPDGSNALRDAAMQQAQLAVNSVATSDENIEQARLRASTLIQRYYELVNWHVEVRFSDPLNFK